MSILVKAGWDLVFRVTICYVVFYATFYFLLALINGMSLQAMMFTGEFEQMAYSTPVIWLKFVVDLCARIAAAAVLSTLGVPKYRFARLVNDHLFTGVTSILPLWFMPLIMLSALTTLAMLTPALSGHILLWIGLHFLSALAMIHYLLNNRAAANRLRLLSV